MTIHTNNSLLPSTKPGVKPPSHKSHAKPLPPFDANPKRQTPTSFRKEQRALDTVLFATWNANGKLRDKAQMQVFSEDMRNRKISVCAIQETRTDLNGEVYLENGDLFVFFGLQANGFGGLGYYISAGWTGRFQTTKKVTDRIVIARFQRAVPKVPVKKSVPSGVYTRTRQRSSLTELEKFFRPTVLREEPAPFADRPAADSTSRGDLVIINTYGFPADKAKKYPKTVCEYYDNLRDAYSKERAGTDLIFVMGDFNAKLGGRGPLDDEIMGRHGKGVRNENGVIMANFLRETNLFAINTFFKHRPMNRATWHGGNPAKKSKNPLRANVGGLHNQIDFILAPRRMITLFTDALSYMPCLFHHRSDHSPGSYLQIAKNS